MKSKGITKFLMAIALSLLAGFFLIGAETIVVIYHINDVHGKIDNFDRVAWLINQDRMRYENVLVMSAGDNFSGNPVVDRYAPRGYPILDLMNRLRFDVQCLGNHEFDYGQDSLIGYLKKAGFQVVCANFHTAKPGFAKIKPYAIFKLKDGIRMAVLGLIQIDPDSKIPDTHPKNLFGFSFSDPLETAKRYRFLKKENQILIGLTHLGYDRDEKLALEMNELDAIVGGHSHTTIGQPELVNGVLIVQAGSDAKMLGRIEIIIKENQIASKKGELIDLSRITTSDLEVKRRIEKFNVNPQLAKVVVRAPFKIEGKDALGSLMCDAVRLIHGLDIVFQNNGGIRSDSLGPDITLKDLFQLDPFNNDIVEFKLSGAEIRDLIRSYSEKRKSIDLQVSGIQYTVVVTPENQISAIELLNSDGTPLAEDKVYRVGLNSYIASKAKFSDPGVSLNSTSNDALIQYLKSPIDWKLYLDGKRANWRINDSPKIESESSDPGG